MPGQLAHAAGESITLSVGIMCIRHVCGLMEKYCKLLAQQSDMGYAATATAHLSMHEWKLTQTRDLLCRDLSSVYGHLMWFQQQANMLKWWPCIMLQQSVVGYRPKGLAASAV